MCEVGLCGPGSCDPQILELILLPAGKDAPRHSPAVEGPLSLSCGFGCGYFYGMQGRGALGTCPGTSRNCISPAAPGASFHPAQGLSARFHPCLTRSQPWLSVRSRLTSRAHPAAPLLCNSLPVLEPRAVFWGWQQRQAAVPVPQRKLWPAQGDSLLCLPAFPLPRQRS